MSSSIVELNIASSELAALLKKKNDMLVSSRIIMVYLMIRLSGVAHHRSRIDYYHPSHPLRRLHPSHVCALPALRRSSPRLAQRNTASTAQSPEGACRSGYLFCLIGWDVVCNPWSSRVHYGVDPAPGLRLYITE